MCQKWHGQATGKRNSCKQNVQTCATLPCTFYTGHLTTTSRAEGREAKFSDEK